MRHPLYTYMKRIIGKTTPPHHLPTKVGLRHRPLLPFVNSTARELYPPTLTTPPKTKGTQLLP